MHRTHFGFHVSGYRTGIPVSSQVLPNDNHLYILLDGWVSLAPQGDQLLWNLMPLPWNTLPVNQEAVQGPQGDQERTSANS
jgi:hypothetical protein